MAARVRPARTGDGPALREIERLAGERFRAIGRPEVADDEPPALDVLAASAAEGRSWVVVDDADEPIGYVLVDVVDGAAHIEQVSVAPAYQGHGIGRALVDVVATWATGEGLASMTLTAFTDVSWNAPLYRRLGFRDLDEHEIGADLRAVRDREAGYGLDPATRVCMRRDLSA